MIHWSNEVKEIKKQLKTNTEAIDQIEQEIQGIYTTGPFQVITKNYGDNAGRERKVYGAGTTKIMSQNFYFNISQFSGRNANDLLFVKMDLKDQDIDGRKYILWSWQPLDNGRKLQFAITLTNFNDNAMMDQICNKARFTFYFTKEASALLENIEE